jgi:DNA polymerase III epsilon subunit-like protein
MYVQPTYEFEWATTADDLARISEQLAGQPILSVDTETSGWQVGNEQLCLIQIGVPTEKRVILVDVLKTGAPTALAPILSAPTPLIIAHNASFEERQFARYDMKVKGVRDTLTMSRQLRPDLPNHTLRTCCKLLLGLELSKQEQTSDWSDYLAALEERASQELDLDIPGLLKEYNYVVRQRFEISREISHEMAFLQAREQKLKDVIRQKLIEGAPNYEGPLGRCTIQKVKRTEVNPQLVRSTFPEFADEVIQEYVDRKRFDAVAKERGLPKNAIESVLDTVGYNDRLNIAIGDDTGLIE